MYASGIPGRSCITWATVPRDRIAVSSFCRSESLAASSWYGPSRVTSHQANSSSASVGVRLLAGLASSSAARRALASCCTSAPPSPRA